MRALTANLATRPFRNNTIIGSIVAAVAISLLTATVYNLYIFLSYGSRYAMLLDDQDRNRAKLEALEVDERSLVKQIEARDFATAFDQGSIANELILKRTFSWTELFNKLENLMPPDVMMSAIRPNVTSSDIVIRVEGVAKTHLAFLNLQEHLLTHEAFSEVYPVSIRRLNPSRPEITFILNFNYRQSKQSTSDTVVAQAVVPPRVGVPSGAETGEQVNRRASIPAGMLQAAATASDLPVGRDGRLRTLEVIARRMVAPGGVYVPAAAQLLDSTANDGGDGGLRQSDGETSGTTRDVAGSLQTTPAAVTATTAAQDEIAFGSSAATPIVTPSAGKQQEPTGSRPKVAGAGRSERRKAKPRPMRPSAAATADVPTATQTPATTTSDGTGRQQDRQPPAGAGDDSEDGVIVAAAEAAAPDQASPGTAEAATPGAAVPSFRPVEQSDLNFVNRPVRDIYRTLGQAHGVRFVVDSAIDRKATLTVDLSGLPIEGVIATMAEAANQRITLLRAGIYQVAAISKGASLLDPPIEEENLPATEGAP